MKTSNPSTPETAKQFSGFFYGAWWAVIGIAFVRLLLQDYSGHFRVFTRAAQALIAGAPVYGTDFGTGVGRYFYSPFAALFFYPFSVPPERLGLALFMGFSIAIFAWGFLKFSKKFELNPWFSFFALPQIFSAIVACKLELMMVGGVLAALAFDFKNKKEVLYSAALLAGLISLKFQPLPIAGLVALALIRNPFFIRFIATLCLVSAIGFFLPTLVTSENLHLWNTLSTTLTEFSREAFLSFDNIYVFLNKVLGFPRQIEDTIVLQGFFALLFGIVLLKKPSVFLAGALGSAFIVLFSPLQQNNALVLWLPFLAFFFEPRFKLRHFETGAWLFAIWGYSDIFPKAWTQEFRSFGLKSLVVLILTACLLFRKSMRDFKHA